MANMLSIPVFVAEHGISRSLFYRLVKEGRGPRLTKIASRTLISAEAAAEWRARMERETEEAASRSNPVRREGQRARRGGAACNSEAAKQ
jgi:predicted DNA-binding transcriptional regulator AlpA